MHFSSRGGVEAFCWQNSRDDRNIVVRLMLAVVVRGNLVLLSALCVCLEKECNGYHAHLSRARSLAINEEERERDHII